MDVATVMGVTSILTAGLGMALSVGSHRSKKIAIPGIVLGSIALLSLLGLALYIASTHRSLAVPLLGLEIACDTLSLLVLMNVVVLGIACLIASYSYCDIVEEPGYGPYYALMILFLISMAAIPLVRDWLWFLFMFEVMTLASYFLIGFEFREPKVARTAWNYFVTMHVLCTIPLVVGVGMIYGYAGTLRFVQASVPEVVLLALFVGFATKSGLFPLHFWLPDAHPIAPTPVSALLSGAMVEMGVYGMYRALELYGPAPTWFRDLVLLMALLSTVAAVASYHRQDDVKRLFAWSTIDNAGWMYLCLVLGMGGTSLGLYILNHGLAKAAAFLSAGLALYVFGTRSIEKLKGRFLYARIALAPLIVSIFALEGVPPFNFFWSRFSVVREALMSNVWVGIAYVMAWTIAFVSFLRVVHKLIEIEHEPAGEEGEVKGLREVPASMLFAIMLLLALLLVSNYVCGRVLELLG